MKPTGWGREIKFNPSIDLKTLELTKVALPTYKPGNLVFRQL